MRSMTDYQEKLAELEQSLQQVLNPVTPSPKFVDELSHKLRTGQTITEAGRPLATIYLAMSFGLFIGVFIFWLIRKIVRANRSRIAE